MSTAWLVLGIALLLLVFLDALWTTLWVDGGAGPLTARLTTWAWHGVLAIVGRKHHRALNLFGPSILVTAVVTWGLLLWAGWVFVFAGEPASLASTTAPETPVDWTDRIWFVAYALATMGNGGFAP